MKNEDQQLNDVVIHGVLGLLKPAKFALVLCAVVLLIVVVMEL
jgi:hypothetical protein